MSNHLIVNNGVSNQSLEMNECHRTLFKLKMFSICKMSSSFLTSHSGTRQSSGTLCCKYILSWDVMVNEKSIKIGNAFHKYTDTGDKSHIEHFSREDIGASMVSGLDN